MGDLTKLRPSEMSEGIVWKEGEQRKTGKQARNRSGNFTRQGKYFMATYIFIAHLQRK